MGFVSPIHGDLSASNGQYQSAIWKYDSSGEIIEDFGISGVDINMGCPSKKIVNSQHGSALMKAPENACKIIDSIRKACSLEVSVKTRLGWKDEKNLIQFGKKYRSFYFLIQ